MRISIGPVLYFWPREVLDAFYRQVADGPADIVYLGETVCSKRRALRPEEWIELGRQLAATGKQVVLSTLTLIEARSEMGVVKRLCGNGEFMVEANDLSAVQLLSEQGVPFVGGPALNIYNGRTLRALRRAGLSRWVMPFEASRKTLGTVLADAQQLGIREGLEVEVFGYGRIPLAYSARCFTARHHNVPKDQCGLRCVEDPEGIPLYTQEGEPFLTINGIQTQSARIYDLLPQWQDVRDAGADIFRISPRPHGTDERVRALCAAVDHDRSLPANPDAACNGYWYGDAGMLYRD